MQRFVSFFVLLLASSTFAAEPSLPAEERTAMLAEFTEVESGKRNDRPVLAQAPHHGLSRPASGDSRKKTAWNGRPTGNHFPTARPYGLVLVGSGGGGGDWGRRTTIARWRLRYPLAL